MCGYQNFNFSLEGDVIKVQLSMEYIRGNNLNEFMRDADKDHVRKVSEGGSERASSMEYSTSIKIVL